MSKLIDKIKSILFGSPEVATAKDAVVKATKVVAVQIGEEVQKASQEKPVAKKPVVKKAVAKKPVAKKSK